MPPLRYRRGRGARVPLARPAAGAACLPRLAHVPCLCLCTIHTFVWSLHRFLPEPLQRAERSSGYPCLDRPSIVACRCHRTRGEGIQSSGVCLQLTYASHQGFGCWCDALGLVQRQQRVDAVSDLLGCHAIRLQLYNFQVA